jgi:hypothetical protein
MTQTDTITQAINERERRYKQAVLELLKTE